ncbi:MAG: sugar phosphate nucleotidyltransferase [Patescibacteria group bacterium]
MKAVIFAGGVGTRLWPVSRKKSPKQFEKIIGDKSTLQTYIDLLLPDFPLEDIYIATGHEYVEMVRTQLNFIPKENVIGEPCRRDVGPAVAFWAGYLAKKFPNEPMIILWSDHLIRNKEKFLEILKSVDMALSEDPNKIIYFGHKPRFASVNLGWIETGAVEKSFNNINLLEFKGFKYRPDKPVAEKYFSNPKYCWNLGSFASTPQYLYSLFERFTPQIHRLTEKILEHIDTPTFEENFAKYYTQMPEIHIDNAIAEQLDKEFAYVIVEDIGWSDIGAWEALKEALESRSDDNVTKGKVLLQESTDTLIYNYEDKKLIVGIDMEDMLVVNTDDVMLVTKKSSVSKIKKLVESFEGTDYEKLT